MMKQKKTFSFGFLLLFALIQFPLRFQNYSNLTFLYVYFVPMVYLAVHLDWLCSFVRRILRTKGTICLILFGIMLLSSCLWPVCMGTFEFSFITEYWRRFFLLLIKNVFLVAFYEREVHSEHKSIEEYFTYYIYSMILYTAFSALILVWSGLRTAMLGCIYLTDKNIVDLQDPSYTTRFGWAGWSGFDATMLCTVGVMMACILILYNRDRVEVQTKYLALSCLLMVGNMFYGRTGLTVSVLCLALIVLWACLRNQAKLVARIITVGVIGVAVLFILQSQVEAIQTWFNWAFSAVVNLIHTGKFQDNTGSVETLLDRMYWMPEMKTFLLGDGYYNGTDGLYYMHTDSGIMRLMLYFGIINYLIGIAATGISYALLCGKMKTKLRTQEKIFAFLLMAIVTILFEIKGESFYKIVCILLPVIFLKEGRERT